VILLRVVIEVSDHLPNVSEIIGIQIFPSVSHISDEL
jgi:hypothetical protein